MRAVGGVVFAPPPYPCVAASCRGAEMHSDRCVWTYSKTLSKRDFVNAKADKRSSLNAAPVVASSTKEVRSLYKLRVAVGCFGVHFAGTAHEVEGEK
jgi:hypothetical protein